MNILVDTSIWSLALRKQKTPEQLLPVVHRLSLLIKQGQAKIIGPIRQEILSGISLLSAFHKLKQALEGFEDLPLSPSEYIRAAEMSNICRKKGIQGSHTDFLICAVAESYELQIFTLDKDFEFYSAHLPIFLLSHS